MAFVKRAHLALLLLCAGCSTIGPLYPPRPPSTDGPPIAEPDPSRIVVHTTVTAEGLRDGLDKALPRSGKGTFSLLGSERRYVWRRSKPTIRFDQGRIRVDLGVAAQADMPIGSIDMSFNLHIVAEPVLTSEYVGKLQSIEVTATSDDSVVKAAESMGGLLERIRSEVQGKVEAFAYDAKPMVDEAYGRLATPIDLPLGDAQGCAELRVLGVEAGPTVLADGIEKDLALVVLPSVTLPCASEGPPPPIPPLANVASITPGPFTVKVAIAARYEELARSAGMMFTDGKYFFSKQFPELYMEKPQVYASQDKLVLSLRIAGPVSKFGFDTMLDGDIFLTGTPVVVDNELRIPDLEPTIETENFLLKLKSAADWNAIRDQARAALRLDVSERLMALKEKIGRDLSIGGPEGCVRAGVTKIEVTGVHAHGAYLRMYVSMTGQASIYVPCPGEK